MIEGTLVDAQGNAIPNAKVSAVDEAKALVVRETTSADDGSFQLRPLQRGTYTVKAEGQGFKTLERSGLVLDINQSMNLGEVGLEVGSVAATVNVTADVPLVETTTAQKSFVISSTQITELSLNGRDFTALMRTLPGVTSAATADFRLQFNDTGSFNVNGGRTSMNNVYLDGTINTDVGDNGSQYTQLSLDAVGEFKVQTSTFNAEFGRNTGVIISATTKSGGKDFHGTLYDFIRNDALDARRPFDTTGNPPKVRFNQFGGNVGGPLALPRFGEGGPALVKGKTFFFFNYEGTRGSQPTGPAFVDVPHPDLLQGDFRRLLRNTNIANSTCRYPGESTNRPCQNGTVFLHVAMRLLSVR